MGLAREGDFIETRENLIFDVKGLTHPEAHVIAFLRYLPDLEGTRFRNLEHLVRSERLIRGVPYKKVYALNERYQMLSERFPHYLYQDQRIKGMVLQAVPHEYIWKIHRPQEYLAKVIEAPRQAQERILKDFALILQEISKISLTTMGVSGSFLVGLATPASDLDFIVYGSQNGRKVYEGIAALFQTPNSPIRPYRIEELKQLWQFRAQDTYLPFEEFVRFEQRKRLQGKFEVSSWGSPIEGASTMDFYIRLVKDWGEITERYGDYQYTPLGIALVEGIILSEDEALFTPCCYPISMRDFYWLDKKALAFTAFQAVEGPVREVVSYRGRFCEARKGEVIRARGTLELVEDVWGGSYLRLVVGNHKQDFLKICDYGNHCLNYK